LLLCFYTPTPPPAPTLFPYTRLFRSLAVLMSFALPTLLGAWWDGWSGALGGFLIGGVAKIVVLQHCTFLINSDCHTLGRQPYSTDRKSTRLNSSHRTISYAVFCLKEK